MLIRTVSRYTDGTPIDRPQVCVSPEYASDTAGAQRVAEGLDKQGYLPPATPMTRAEWAAIFPEATQSALAVWDVCGLGLTLSLAAKRHGYTSKNSRRALQRLIKKIGWISEDQ